jgi:dTDP-3-amino-3,4,6-trideoxy-alpha-D-glucose transaminase
LQAAFLRHACLPRLEQWTRRRREIAAVYLAGIRHANISAVSAPEGSESCWHLFPVRVKSLDQSGLLEHLKGSGISAGIHYPIAIPDQPVLKTATFELADDCTLARRFCGSEVSLPMHPYLTDTEVDQVVRTVNAW